MMLRRIFALIISAALALSLAACAADPKPGETVPPVTSVSVTLNTAEMFTDRDMDPGYDSAVSITLSDDGSTGGAGVVVEGNTVTITAAGTYLVSGKLTAGQLRVAAGEKDKVQLVLKGAGVANAGHAALHILSADKVFLTLAEGTENTLAATGDFGQTDDNVDAAVFSKSDLVINGSGKLAVSCEKSHGIVSKDDLKITGGSLEVKAAKQGISGKDSLRIAGGSITVDAGTDGIRSKNTEDATKGYVYIKGGALHITAGNDGVSASSTCLIEGGALDISTGEGSASVTHSEGQWGGGMWPGGWGGQGGTTTEDTQSIKGIKAGGDLVVTGGSFQIDAEDDALHANQDLTVTGGAFAIASGDDALHAESTLLISGGTLEITKSYEGLEGNYITVSGGEISLVASDDGMNAAGGNDGSGMAGPFGGFGGFGEATDAYILISGGSLVMNAGGDGIDSNGDLTVTGGVVYVDGPTNSGNGPLDYAGNAKITGGTVIALGSAGMAMNFGTDSTQGSILCSINGSAPAGSAVAVKDSKGNVLASYVSRKTFQSILISAPGMEQGGTYTVSVGQASLEITLDSIIYGSGMGGGPGGPGGRPGGPGGKPPGK